MYSENNIEYQSYLQVMNFFTRGNSCKKFKNTFYEKKLWTCSRYILIHHWETADCSLTNRQKNFIMFQELLFGWKEFSVFIQIGGMYNFFNYIIDKKQRRERIDCC